MASVETKTCTNEPLYTLSCELIGHSDAVRSVTAFRNGNIVSASRDRTARLWVLDNGKYKEMTVMKGHTDYVSAVCVVEPSETNPMGFIVTGGYDKKICVYYPGDEQPIHTIVAHKASISNLKTSVAESESFLSCSFDNTGKLWNLYDLKAPTTKYAGHIIDSIIWSIADLLNGFVVTVGSDKTVVVYQRSGEIFHTLQGHSECIRDVAAITDCEFITCGNDATTKLWDSVSGKCRAEYTSHRNYVYSASSTTTDNLVATCGEDKTIVIWKNRKIIQTLAVPSETLWCVKILDNTDIVCASSDGYLRVFTADETRYANEEVLTQYEDEILKKWFNRIVNQEPVEQFPQSKELLEPGKRDGDNVIIRERGAIKVYKWSSKQFQWFLVGDVLKCDEKIEGKPKHKGIEYDYVFSVDIEEGKPLLPLPYNKGEDPYHAAMRFLNENNVSKRHLKEVINFITTSIEVTPVLNPGKDDSQPSTSRDSTSIYVPTQESYIPRKFPVKLMVAKLDPIVEKLELFNRINENGTELPEWNVPSDKLKSIVQLVKSQSTNPKFDTSDITTLKSMLKWPDEYLFPVLDIIRILVLQKDINREFCTDETFCVLKRHFQNNAIVHNQMISFRILANLFVHEEGEQFCLNHIKELVPMLPDIFIKGYKGNDVALSTYILNVVVAVNKWNDIDGKMATLCVISSFLGSEVIKDKEALFRLAVALGTLMIESQNGALIQIVSKSRPILNALMRMLLSANPQEISKDKLVAVNQEIIDLIKKQ